MEGARIDRSSVRFAVHEGRPSSGSKKEMKESMKFVMVFCLVGFLPFLRWERLSEKLGGTHQKTWGHLLTLCPSLRLAETPVEQN